MPQGSNLQRMSRRGAAEPVEARGMTSARSSLPISGLLGSCQDCGFANCFMVIARRNYSRRIYFFAHVYDCFVVDWDENCEPITLRRFL